MDNRRSNPGDNTRLRILEAAELLFAENGYAVVTTRQIATTANVALSALPYHFGSKLEIMRQVLDRHIRPMQLDRARRLATVAEQNLQGESLVRAVLEALLVPAFESSSHAKVYSPLIGIVSTDPNPEVRAIANEVISHYPTGIPELLKSALPHLTEREFYWRFYCVVGAMVYAQLNTGRLESMSDQRFESSHPEEHLDLMVEFFLGGLSARAARPPGNPA